MNLYYLIKIRDRVRAIEDGWNRTHNDVIMQPSDPDRNYDYKKGDTGVVVKVYVSYNVVFDVKMDSGRFYRGAVAKNWKVVVEKEKVAPEPEPMWRLIRL